MLRHVTITAMAISAAAFIDGFAARGRLDHQQRDLFHKPIFSASARLVRCQSWREDVV